MISPDIPLVKSPKTKTYRTYFEEICEESSISQPHKSLFLASFSTLFEIILRFENESSLGISDFISQRIMIQIENLKKVFPNLQENFGFIINLLKVIRDSSTFDLITRKKYLIGYLTQEGVTQNLSFMMQKILILNFNHDILIQRLEYFDFDKNLAELCLEKVSEIFSLAIVLIFEDGTTKQLIKLRQKCPLAYFFVSNQGEVVILYTKSMIDENHFEENKLVRSPSDVKTNEENAESHYEKKILIRFQSENFKSLQAFKNVVESSSCKGFRTDKISMVEENFLMNSKGKSIQSSGKLPPPVLFPNKKQKEELNVNEKAGEIVSRSNSYEQSSIETKSGPNNENPPLRPELPPEIVKFINHVSELISKNNIYDKKLQDLTRGLVDNFPELGKNTERLICSIREPLKAEELLPEGFLNIPRSPGGKLGPSLNPFPNPPISSNPLINSSKIPISKLITPSNSQNFSKTKICSFNSNPEPENIFSIHCLDCSNTICNKCRVLDTKSCVKCKRQYNKSEIILLENLFLSMNLNVEKPVIVEEVKLKYEEKKIEEEVKIKSSPEVQLTRSTRKIQSFRKCNEHLIIVDEELFNKDFKCFETCGVCNECRIKNLKECIRCKHVYNDDEKNLIQMIKISMQGS